MYLQIQAKTMSLFSAGLQAKTMSLFSAGYFLMPKSMASSSYCWVRYIPYLILHTLLFVYAKSN